MGFELIKNKLTILLYGLDGGEDIDKQLNDNPDNINLEQDDINYMLFDSFSDFMDNVSHKLNRLYDEDTSGEEEDEEEDEEDEEEDEEESDEETYIDNILWFIDSYVIIKDKLWVNWLKETSETNKLVWEELHHLQEENTRLRQLNKVRDDHIDLQYHKEHNKLIRQSRDIKLREDKMRMKNETQFSNNKRNKQPYPRKNCWKCRGSINGICVQHGG